MSAPTNVSPASATVISALPASITQTVDDAGTTYPVWYAYTATADDVEIGLFGYGDNTAYYVGTQVYNDIAAGAGARIISTGLPPDSTTGNKTVQFPVTPGTTYYIKLSPPTGNPSPAVLSLEVESFEQQTAPIGSFVINDDTEGYPAVIIDSATGEPLRFLNPFPNGESADVLTDGTSCYADFGNSALKIYDNQFNLTTTIPSVDVTALGGCVRTCQGTQRFWFSYVAAGPTNRVRSLQSNGTLGTEHTLTAVTSVYAIAASNDETILYHVASGVTKAIKRWDLANDVALSDLVAAVTNYRTADILVLPDNSILCSYIKTSGGNDVQVRRYNAAGTTLNTYNFGSAFVFPSGTFPRLFYAGSDSTAFGIMLHPSGADEGLTDIQVITVATGAVASTRTGTEFESGVYNRTPTPTPVRFGNSFSCTVIMTRAEFPDAPPGGSGTITVVKVTLPSSDDTAFDFVAGGGLTPDEFSLSTGEQQVYNSVPVGDGYSVVETPNAGYVTTVTVSNDSPNTNISVADGENVVVTFTNSAMGTMNFDVEPIKRRWLRRTPIYSNENSLVRWIKVWLDMQPGMGNTVDPGVDPKVYFRYSSDFGQTWSSTRVLSAGKKGRYDLQLPFWNCGIARNFVVEFYGSDPCPVYINNVLAQVEPGTY